MGKKKQVIIFEILIWVFIAFLFFIIVKSGS